MRIDHAAIDRAGLTFSVSQGLSLRRFKNVTWTWDKLKKWLSESEADTLTLAQYKALPPDQQNRRKNNGSFMGAPCDGGLREAAFMGERQLLLFDLDDAPAELILALETGMSALGNVAYCVYSTRTHGGGKVKLRVVVPLPAPLDKDKFQAVARVLAWRLDPEMRLVDKVSFVEGQLFYRPSHCRDVEPVWLVNRGPMLDAEAVLAGWTGDWTDMKSLPMCPNERDFHRRDRKAQEPTLKRGWVGAFCRIYDVRAAIDKFIPHLYVVAERDRRGLPSRYSWTQGKASNGALVLDNGSHFRSHHGSDPLCGLNVNSYDMTRIQKFGHLDTPELFAAADGDTRKLPSYAAMNEWLREDAAVQKELIESNYPDDDDQWDAAESDGEATGEETAPYARSGGVLDGVSEAKATPIAPKPFKPAREAPGKADKTQPEVDWRERLETTEHGIAKPTVGNILLILENARTFRGLIGYDTFANRAILRRRLRWKPLGIDLPGGPDEWLSDDHASIIRIVLESPRKDGGYGMRVAKRDLDDALAALCARNRYNPLTDWLAGLAWDGTPRMERLWPETIGVPDEPYYREIGEHFLVGCVLRAFEPGAHFDHVVLFHGDQEMRKSSIVEAIGGKWAGELDIHAGNSKQLIEETAGYWVLEIPELAMFKRADVNTVKSLITRRKAQVRLAYERREKRFPRSFVLLGTTNEKTFLADKSGNRRFWLIPVDRLIRTEWLEENRDQLFAEAVARYRERRAERPRGVLPFRLTTGAEAQSRASHQLHMAHDPADEMAGQIEDWLDTPVPRSEADGGTYWMDAGTADEPDAFRTVTCIREISDHVFPDRRSDDRLSHAVARAMERVPGWDRKPGRTKGANVHRFARYGLQRAFVRLPPVGGL